jgi:hypothetical protein
LAANTIALANPETADVNRTIEYRADRWLVGWLPYTLLLSALGIWMATFEVGRHKPAGWVVLLIAGTFSAFLLFRLYNPGRSRLTLSPAGLQLYVRGADVLIPWREIQSVDTMDVKVRNWSRGSILFPYITFRDCTVAKASRPFYEEAVHTPSVLMQGPGWEGVFQPDGDSMRIALHHEQFVVSPQDVRIPVEARWRAFRGRSHPAARAEEEAAANRRPAATDTISDAASSIRRTSTIAASPGEPIRFGDAALLATPWDMLKLGTALVALIIIGSNALGLWETEGQQDRRLERQVQAEEARREREEEARRKKHWDDFWKDFNRTMNRPFEK